MSRAFTLLEVVLAVALAVGLVGAMFGLYFRSSSLRERANEHMDFLLAERLVMDQVTRELRSAMEFKFLRVGLEGQTDRMEFSCARLPGPSVWMESTVTEDPPPAEADVQLVGYRLRTEADETGQEVVVGLERTCQRSLLSRQVEEADAEAPGEDADNTALPTDRAEVEVLLVTDRIRHLRLRYWDGTDWLEQWTGGDLPGAVEVTLGDRPMGEDQDESEYTGTLYRRVVYLPGGIRSAMMSRIRGLGGSR
jgi:type II secretory pathway component PulJ